MEKSPSVRKQSPYFFLLREKLTNFTLAKQKGTAFSTMVDRMEKRDAEVNSTPLFSIPKRQRISSDLFS